MYCVYLPCRDSTPHYKSAVGPIYAYVEDILATFYNDNHIIAGDFNFECRPGDLGFVLMICLKSTAYITVMAFFRMGPSTHIFTIH